MVKTLDTVQRNFTTVRTGRANPSMLDRIVVDYYGAPTPLKQIASMSTPEATTLVVQPFDTTAIPAIERAIQQSDIGLTPNNDGKIIRLIVPQLTAVRFFVIWLMSGRGSEVWGWCAVLHGDFLHMGMGMGLGRRLSRLVLFASR